LDILQTLFACMSRNCCHLLRSH